MESSQESDLQIQPGEDGDCMGLYEAAILSLSIAGC